MNAIHSFHGPELVQNKPLAGLKSVGAAQNLIDQGFEQNGVEGPNTVTEDRIIAQHDGLDSPPKFWHYFDLIDQLHVLKIPSDTLPGKYELQIGLYNPDTGQRALQSDYAHSDPPSDHYVLGTIQVTR